MKRLVEWDSVDVRVDGAKLNALAASFRVDPIEKMELQFFNGLLRITGSVRKFISVPFTIEIRELRPSGHTVSVHRGRDGLRCFFHLIPPKMVAGQRRLVRGSPPGLRRLSRFSGCRNRERMAKSGPT